MRGAARNRSRPRPRPRFGHGNLAEAEDFSQASNLERSRALGNVEDDDDDDYEDVTARNHPNIPAFEGCG